MFWLGRLNAILAILGSVGLTGSFFFGWEIAVLWVVFMILVRVFLWLTNLLMTAFTGTPLYYNYKQLKDGSADDG